MPVTERISLKNASKIALATMSVFLCAAVVFFKERMLFLDAPFITFLKINLQNLKVEERRYGSYVTQIFPLLGSKLHLGFKTVLVTYSLSFNLFFLTVMLFLVYRFKQYGMAILMCLYYTLFVSDSWFWTNNEVHQGIAFMFLFFAVAFNMAKQKTTLWIQVPVFAFLVALSVFTHPLIFISVFYLWFFLWADKKIWPYNKIMGMLFTVLIACVSLFKIYVSNTQGYDHNKMHPVRLMSLDNILHTFRSQIADTFWHDCLVNYWWALLIFALGIFMLIREKRYLQLLLTLAFSVGFFVLVCLVYGPVGYDYHARFYLESVWMTLSIIIAAPFVFYVLPKLTETKACILISAIFITRFIYIAAALPLFQNRVAFIENGLAQMRKKKLTKVVIINDGRTENAVLMTWGLAYESICASKLHGDDPQLTFLSMSEQPDIHGILPTDNKMMMGGFGWEQVFNPYYFRIDTTRPYTIMTYDQLFKK